MGFFDTLVNAFSQYRTNKQNAQNVRETNEANMYMNQQNLTYAKAMFDKQMVFTVRIFITLLLLIILQRMSEWILRAFVFCIMITRLTLCTHRIIWSSLDSIRIV